MSENPNVRINIPPPGVMKDELSVAGEREGVLKVVEQIKKFHQDLVSLGYPYPPRSVRLPKDLVG